MQRSFALVSTFALAAALVLGSRPLPARAGGDFDLPIGGSIDTGEDPATPSEEGQRSPKFYDEDIPTTTDSVIYVLDRSGSMDLPVRPFTGLDGQPVTNGSRLDYVKTEMVRSVASLPAAFTFNMIVFSECVEAWKPERVAATPDQKAAAVAWIQAIEATGWTNTGGATSRALADRGNRTIMLLSDGEPNFLDCAETYVGDYDTHRRVIREANGQRAAVHCFGIALDDQTRSFMQSVASDNEGSFKELD